MKCVMFKLNEAKYKETRDFALFKFKQHTLPTFRKLGVVCLFE